MRGFFAFAKSFVSYSVPKTQQMRLTIRFVNQTVNNQFRMCSSLTALRINNLFGIFQTSSLEEGGIDGLQIEFDLENEINQVSTLSLKAECRPL